MNEKTQVETPVMKFLQEREIAFRLLPHDEPVYTCEKAARVRKAPLSEMAKCLVFVEKKTNRVIVATVPADRKVSVKKLRGLLKIGKVRFATSDEIQQHLGYPRGAVPPICLPSDVLSVIDNSLLRKRKTNLSSGQLTAGLEMATHDLRKICDGKIGNVSE